MAEEWPGIAAEFSAARPPDRLGLKDVRTFQVYLPSGGVSWGSLNQSVVALSFFTRLTLSQAEAAPRGDAFVIVFDLARLLTSEEAVFLGEVA